ncbi:MAG: amidohydrolase [Coriobacteriales bacterium]|jgi:5-methylthioadenosine/S-adenosylhomocysteine deaminase|nr:amidohydrolase [Coriobacteriales bacterium]
MLFSDIDYLDSDFTIKHGYVGVTGDRISYMGTSAPADLSAYGSVYSGHGRLLMPGLYNIHAHAAMTLLRGYAENLRLQEWLTEQVFPFEAKITEPDAYAATTLAIAEMLRFGVVSVSDMYFFDSERIRAVGDSGFKANLSPALNIFDPDVQFQDLPECAENERLVKEFHGSEDGRLLIDLNIHSEYLSNPQVVQAVGDQAVELGVATHIHLSETRLEHEECKARRGGLTPAAYFESLGFFRQPCTAAHCVWTDPEDWQIMIRNGVTAAANPASNFKLGSGFAPIAQMLEAGVQVGLGTDGMASNNNHNMFKDLYLLATVYKASSEDPTVVTPAEALAAATINGARAQGRADCGSIIVGNRADLIVLNTDIPWMKPVSSQLNNLVFAAQGSDVVLTMVDGQVLYKDGEWTTIDIEQISAATQMARDRIVSEL